MALRFILLALGITLVSSTCPSGWAEFDGECLYFSKTAKSWVDAEASCRAKQAYLATDDNPKKHEFIRSFLNVFQTWGASRFWLGGSDYVIEGQWRWVETGIAMNGFSIWGPGYPQPDSLSQSCLVTYFNGTEMFWADHSCGHIQHGHHSHGYNYICEKQSSESVQIIG